MGNDHKAEAMALLQNLMSMAQTVSSVAQSAAQAEEVLQNEPEAAVASQNDLVASLNKKPKQPL